MFAKDSNILMYNGELRKCEDVFAGDRLSGESELVVYNIVYNVLSSKQSNILCIDFGKDKIKVTEMQMLVTPSGLLKASEIKIGDKLIFKRNKVVTVKQIRKENYNDLVFNFDLRDEYLLYVNGITVGSYNLNCNYCG